MKHLRIVNCAEIVNSPDWNFLQDILPDIDADWTFHQCEPTNWLESMIQKPRISRYRACMRAALDSRRGESLIISHLPGATFWTERFNQLVGRKVPHLAFSFNFTDLPTGRKKAIMMRAFQTIDRFVVYSTVEKMAYANYFNIDPSKIDVLLWAMDMPEVQLNRPMVEGEYACAVGGEGRDYRTLLAAIRELPQIKLVVVARPANLAGLEIPPNVKVFTNLPTQDFWSVVKFSKCSIIPLRDEHTNCGHISLVGSMLFGKPLITTNSRGIDDYVDENKNGLIVCPGDKEELIVGIQRLWSDSDFAEELGQTSLRYANERHQLQNWANYLRNYLSSR